MYACLTSDYAETFKHPAVNNNYVSDAHQHQLDFCWTEAPRMHVSELQAVMMQTSDLCDRRLCH